MKKTAWKIVLLTTLVLFVALALAACGKVEFKLNFMVEDEVYATINTNGAEVIKMPTNPTKEGFVFDGWYWDKDSWQRPFTANSLLDAPLSSDMSVYAKWSTPDSVQGTGVEISSFEIVGENEFNLIVPNQTVTLSLGDYVSVNSKSSWTLSTDIYGNNTIASKTASLAVGDNLYYILVTADNGTSQLYTLNIRRKPIYNVIFDTNGGSAVAKQEVEEGSFATAPTTEKAGYTLVSWNHDFANPITDNLVIVATWSANKYKINYNADGGEIADAYTEVTYAEKYTLSVPTKRGYSFSGWYQNEKPIENGTYLTAGDITVKAKWSIVDYQISYDLKGGSVEGVNPTSYNVASNNIILNNPTQLGYEFVGWTGTDLTEPSKGVIIYNNSIGNRSYIANWKFNGYIINYNLNGGTNSAENPIGFTIASPDVYLSNPTKEGYIFGGWFTTESFADGSKITTIPSGSTGDVDVYAKWTAITYSVKFNANGGNGVMNNQLFTYDVKQDLDANKFTLSGYSFVGWSDQKTDGTAKYADSANLSNLSNTQGEIVELFAVWKAISSTVTFDKGISEGGTDSVVATFDQSMPSAVAPAVPFGYAFNGYYDADGSQYYDSLMTSTKNWDKTVDATLYARFTAKGSTVTFDKQGGADGTGSINAIFDSQMPQAVAPTKAGYDFQGYFYQENGQGTQYYNSEMTSVHKWDREYDATLYAHYTPCKYPVTFDFSEGECSQTQITATYLEQLPDLSVAPSRTGYTFLGYFDSANGGKKYYNADLTSAAEWDKTTSATLYANWQANTYRVRFDINGGTSGSMSDETFAYDESKTLTTNAFSNTGYCFAGWTTNADGTGASYSNGQTVSNLSSVNNAVVILYAKWTANAYAVTLNDTNTFVDPTYTVSFDLNGGSGNIPSQTVNSTTGLTYPAIPTRSGYAFAGWYDSNYKPTSNATYAIIPSGAKQYNGHFYYCYELEMNWEEAKEYCENVGGHLVTIADAEENAWIASNYNATYCWIGGYRQDDQWYWVTGEPCTYFNWNSGEPNNYNGIEDRLAFFTSSGKWNDSTYNGQNSTTYEYVRFICEWDNTNVFVESTGLSVSDGVITGIGSCTDSVLYLNKPIASNAFKSNSTITAVVFGKGVTSIGTQAFYSNTNLRTVIFLSSDASGIGSDVFASTWDATDFMIYVPADALEAYQNVSCQYWQTYMLAKNKLTTGGPEQLNGIDTGTERLFDFSAPVTKDTTAYAKWVPMNSGYSTAYIDAREYSGSDSAYSYSTSGSSSSSYIYKYFTVLTSGTYYLYYKNGSSSTSYATYLYVYNATQGQAIKSNGYVTNTSYSYVSFSANAGDVIYVRTYRYSTSYSTTFTLYVAGATTPAAGGKTTGSGMMALTQSVSFGSAFTLSTDCEKEGYTFAGWYDGVGGTGTQYTDKDGNSVRVWDKAANTTLYAKWIVNSYTVTFDKQGGTSDADTVIVTYDSEMPVCAAPELDGYDFEGYFDENGTQYYNASMGSVRVWDKTANATLYARYKGKTYTITFDKQGGSNGTNSVAATYNSTVPAATAPSRTGYTFQGYFDALNGGGKQYYSGSMEQLIVWDKQDSATLYAYWTISNYIVSFSANGGTGTQSNVSVTYGSAMPEITTVPTRTGYTFLGYYDSVSGGKKYYNADLTGAADWDKTSATTLYANWQANTYRVRFDINGGTSGSMSDETFAYDEAKALTTNAFSKTGYYFAGWTTNPDGTGASYSNGQTVSNLSSVDGDVIILYAKWIANSYTVTMTKDSAYTVSFDLNGGSGNIPSQTVNSTTGLTYPAIPTRSGYAFAGWYDSDYKSAVDIPFGAKQYNGHSYFCYEIEMNYWEEAKEYCENLGGHLVTIADAEENAWIASNFNAVWCWIGGYKEGDQWYWVTGEPCTYFNWYPGEPNNTGGVENKLVFYASSGMWNDASSYDTPYVRFICEWDFTGEVNPFDFSAPVTKDTTVYAKWAPMNSGYSTAYIDAREYSGSDSAYSYSTSGSSSSSYIYKYFTTLTSGTYYLYYKNGSSSTNYATYLYVYNVTQGKVIRSNGYVTSTSYSSVSFSANAGDVIYVRTYRYNTSYSGTTFYMYFSGANTPIAGGEMYGTTQNVTYDSAFVLSTDFEKEGYTFDGWYDGVGGTGTQYTDKDGNSVRVWDKAENTTLYAKWNVNSYTISFVSNGGSTVAPITQDYATVVNAPIPTWEEKSFVGWFDSTLTNEYVFSTMPAEDITLYAKWVDYEVSLTYSKKTEISINDEINAALFNATAVDTDGNPVEVAVQIIGGTKTVGNKITVRLVAMGLYDIYAMETVADISVYGAPTLTYDTEKDYINLTDTVNASLFGASAVDTFGDALTVSVSVKEETYQGGDIVTVVISTVDRTGNETKVEIENVKVYGTPVITRDLSVVEIKASDTIGNALFGVSAADSFGVALEVTTVQYSGTLAGGNTITVKSSTTDSKGNTNNVTYSVKVYGLPSIGGASTTEFRVEDEITLDALGIVAKDSFNNVLENVTLELTEGTQISGASLTYFVTATDHLGNVNTREITGIRIFGAPTITFDTGKNAMKVTDAVNADLLSAAAKDSFQNSLNVSVVLNSGAMAGGNVVTFKLSATDHLGNYYETVSQNIKVYSSDDIVLTYTTVANNIRRASAGEEFNAQAVNGFGEICETSIVAADGYTLAGGNTINLYIVATDALGNIATSELITNIKVYDTPTLVYTRDCDYIQNGDSPYALFRVLDSFNKELMFDVEVLSGSLDVNETITYRITAKDKVKNEFSQDYTLVVLDTDESILELYKNGEKVGTQRVYKNADFTLPYYDGYDVVWYFDGSAITDNRSASLVAWDKDSNVYVVNTAPSVITYNISYSLNGGTNAKTNPATFTVEDAIVLSAPTRAGYTFTGWSDSGTIALGSIGDKTFSAYWEINTYSITYILNDGTNAESNPTTYTVEDEITLAAPSRTDYAFAGWSNGGTISRGSTGNKTITAFWRVPGQDLSFTSNGDGTCYVSGIGSCTDTDVFIPTLSPAGDIVTGIGEWAFYDCYNLTSVTIGDSVTSIGGWAFYSCDRLNAVYYTGDIVGWCGISFGYNANPLSIAHKLYLDDVLLTDLVFPDTVTSISGSALNGCTSLVSVTIPESVTSIDGSPFYGCTRLIEVCNLSSLSITAGRSNYGYVGYYAKHVYSSGDSYLNTTADGFVFYDDGTEVYLVSYNGDSTELIFPANYNGKNYAILQGAFYGSSYLTLVTIPDSVTSIGNEAFRNCTGLTSIVIPDSVTSIGNEAFRGCSELTSVTIGNEVTSIGEYAFEECDHLTAVYYTGDVAGWSRIAFGYDANPLLYAENLYINDSLVTDLVIPNGVTSIGFAAFEGCTSLTSVTIPNSVTSIGEWAFSGCSGLTSVIIPDSVTAIGSRAFNKCTGLSSVTIGNGVATIGSYAFYNCFTLTSITIPNSVTSIRAYAFSGCSALTSISIGSSVGSIETGNFYGCTNLASITVSGSNSVYRSSGNCLIETASKTLIIGCKNSVIPNDGSVTSIGASAFYGCTGLTSINIPSSVTSIGDSAFEDCSALTTVTISDNITRIDDRVFFGCNSLQYNEYSNACYIGNASNPYVVLIKAKNTSITSCTIHSKTKVIFDSAFHSCTGLTSITIPDSVKDVGGSSFHSCYNLTSVTIGSGVTCIRGHAFYCCNNLSTLTFRSTSGWFVTRSRGASSGTNMTVTNASTNATNMKNDYYYYYWYRK